MSYGCFAPIADGAAMIRVRESRINDRPKLAAALTIWSPESHPCGLRVLDCFGHVSARIRNAGPLLLSLARAVLVHLTTSRASTSLERHDDDRRLSERYITAASCERQEVMPRSQPLAFGKSVRGSVCAVAPIYHMASFLAREARYSRFAAFRRTGHARAQAAQGARAETLRRTPLLMRGHGFGFRREHCRRRVPAF